MIPLLLALLAVGTSPGGPVQLQEEPRRVHSVEPEYPPAAARQEEEEDVVLECNVNHSGRVLHVRALSSRTPFTEAAEAATLKWRYEPISDHRERRFSVRVRFRLADKPIHRLPSSAVLEEARSSDAETRSAAWREIADRGEALLPELLGELAHGDATHRCTATSAVRGLGPKARAAAPRLLELVRREDGATSCYPGDALFRVAPEEFAAELRRAISSGDARLCRGLVDGLSADHERTPEPVLAALALEGCREAAADTLTFTRDARAAPHLLRALDEPSRAGREELIGALGSLVTRDDRAELKPWLPQIVKAMAHALEDPDAEVRVEAAMSLEELGPDGAAAVDALVRALRDPQDQVRWRAVRALGSMGSHARAAGPELLKMRETLPRGREGPDDLNAAIEATRAGKDDARLAVEDEIRAAVVEHVVAQWTEKGRTPRFTLMVLGETAPKGLFRAMARRGVKVATGDRRRVVLGAVKWTALDLVEVQTTFDGGMDSSGTSYVVALRDGRWTVVSARGGWISAAPRSPGIRHTEVARAKCRRGEPWGPLAPPSEEG